MVEIAALLVSGWFSFFGRAPIDDGRIVLRMEFWEPVPPLIKACDVRNRTCLPSRGETSSMRPRLPLRSPEFLVSEAPPIIHRGPFGS